MTFDYNGIQAELTRQLSLTSNWATTLYYGVYARIIDLISYAFNKDVYLGYFLYKESGWSTAERTSSLVTMGAMLNYTPHRMQGATGVVKMSMSSTFDPAYVYQGNNIYIPQWTKFSNTSKSVNVYCSSFTTYFTNTVGTCSIPVTEGIPKSFTYIATGKVNEKIYLYSGSIDNNNILVYQVDSLGNIITTITQVPNLYFMNEPSTYYYTLTNSPNFDYVYLTFGDNISTKQLAQGTYILIQYAETKGDQGDIQATGVISKIGNTLYDSLGNTVTQAYVTNSSLIAGGTAVENIESIRNNAPNLFGSGYRCGTLKDWNAVLNSISFIQSAQAWTINQFGQSTLLADQNSVFITALGTNGFPLSVTNQVILISYLQSNYSSPTEVIQYVSPQEVYISFTVNVTTSTVSPDVMTNAVATTLYNAYNTTNSYFALKLYQSEYVAVVTAINGVMYHDTIASMMDYNLGTSVFNQAFYGYFAGTLNTSYTTDAVIPISGSPTIWIKRYINGVWQSPVQVAYSSGAVWIPKSNPWNVASANWNISSNSISYYNYTYSFSLNDILSVDRYGQPYGNAYDPTQPLLPYSYITTVIYSTKDALGKQLDSFRLSQLYQISQIDSDFIFTTVTEV